MANLLIHFWDAFKNFWMKYNINNVVLVCNTSGNCYDFVLFWNLQSPLAFHFRTDSNKMWFLKRWWKKWKVNEIALAKVLLFDNLLFRKTPSSQTFSDVSVVFFTHFWSIDSDFVLLCTRIAWFCIISQWCRKVKNIGGASSNRWE